MRLVMPNTNTVTKLVLGLASAASLIAGAVLPLSVGSGASGAESADGSATAASVESGDAARASNVLQWSTVEQDNAKVTYAGSGWSTLSNFNSSGQSVRVTTSGGASASMSFTGTGIRWVSWKSANSGIAEVYVDGRKVDTVDRYAKSSSYQQVVFERTGLDDGAHSIRIVSTGKRNTAASSNNLLLDAFQVQQAKLLAAPAAPKVTATGTTGATVSWSAVTGVAAYDVYRSADGAAAVKINTTQLTQRSYLDAGLSAGVAYRYSVKSVDSAGQLSPLSATTTAFSVADPVAPYRTALDRDCPSTPTITVRTTKELWAALKVVGPGDVLRLADGTYTGTFQLTRSGTAEKPIWICGSKNAVIEPGSVNTEVAFRLDQVAWVALDGFTIRKALQGVMVKFSSHVRISHLDISQTGYEAVHLYAFTTDSVVADNWIHSTGMRDTNYGEGVYIGTSPARWDEVTGGRADKSDRNLVIGNTLEDIGSEGVEAKPGTSGGIIQSNVITGHRPGSTANAWVLVSGEDWLVRSNRGANAVENGFRIGKWEGLGGAGNVFDGNSGSVNAPGWGVLVHMAGTPTPPGTFVSCSNALTGARSGTMSIACGK